MPRIIPNHHEFNSFAKLSAGGVTACRDNYPGQHKSCTEKGAFTCLVSLALAACIENIIIFYQFCQQFVLIKKHEKKKQPKTEKNTTYFYVNMFSEVDVDTKRKIVYVCVCGFVFYRLKPTRTTLTSTYNQTFKYMLT